MIKDSQKDLQPEPEYEFSCPHCSKKFKRSTTKVFPFCCVRCQQIDLGRWYNEEYTLPSDGEEDIEDGLEGDSN